jgi:KDO2-lipid IV(A) lauroyltransferase
MISLARARSKAIFKWAKRGPGAWAAFVLLGHLYLLLKVVPESSILAMGKNLGKAILLLAGPRKRVALENLRLALGDSLEPWRRREIMARLMVSLGLNLAELGHEGFMSLGSLRKRVALQGLENLDRALERGSGAILATAHFGNFPLILARFGLEGYPIGVIIRDPRHRPVAKFLDEWRSRYGVRTVKDKPRWRSAKEGMALLRSNGVLTVHTDLNVSEGGLFVPFFGHWVPSFAGPALMSLRTQAPILPTFIRRVHGLEHRIVIMPQVKPPLTGKKEEDVWRISTILSLQTERAIRKYPDQWWWIHRRFRKRRPEKEVGRPIPQELLDAVLPVP